MALFFEPREVKRTSVKYKTNRWPGRYFFFLDAHYNVISNLFIIALKSVLWRFAFYAVYDGRNKTCLFDPTQRISTVVNYRWNSRKYSILLSTSFTSNNYLNEIIMKLYTSFVRSVFCHYWHLNLKVFSRNEKYSAKWDGSLIKKKD